MVTLPTEEQLLEQSPDGVLQRELTHTSALEQMPIHTLDGFYQLACLYDQLNTIHPYHHHKLVLIA